MGMGIGVAVLVGLAVLGIYLWRAGHLSGPQSLDRHMHGCCAPRGFEPSCCETTSEAAKAPAEDR